MWIWKDEYERLHKAIQDIRAERAVYVTRCNAYREQVKELKEQIVELKGNSER